MTAGGVDLHCHSTASDGTLAPAAVVRLAKKNGLTGLALTDHDTVAGIAEATATAAELGVDFIPGIEISCAFVHPGTLHMLGYGVDPSSSKLVELTTTLQASRADRNPRMVAKLNELGIAVTMDEWQAQAKGDILGRPHLAAILLRKGYVTSMKQAFNKYLGDGALAYVDKERLPSRQAIAMIHDSGGVAVLAHAFQLRRENFAQIETVITELRDEGLAGIEVIHSDHDETLTRQLDHLADRLGVLKTGGSDYHGSNKPTIDLGHANGRRIPRGWFDKLRERLAI